MPSESEARIYRDALFTCNANSTIPRTECLARVGKFSSRRVFRENGTQKAKEIQQFCSMLAKQNKTKNTPTEVIRLWTDRKDIRKHQSTSRPVHNNSASLLYQFRSILMCHEGELMFNNKIKLT